VNVRAGILFATPGTTCESAMVVYDQITRAAELRFQGVEPRWTYTSAPIRRKLAAQGNTVPTPGEALLAMQNEGFTHTVVMPLHLSDGMEFTELAQTVAAWSLKGAPMKVSLGQALLTSPGDWERALRALITDLPKPPDEKDGILLVAHGSRDPQAQRTILAAAQHCRTVDRRLILGMMLGKPGLEDVLRECKATGVRKVWLLPCMVVAGFSAQADIAGAGEHSWASALERAGIESLPVPKGLGEVNGIVQIWLDAVERMLTELTGSNGWKVK
jgi:sirohydrochlorin cobaltochelatase